MKKNTTFLAILFIILLLLFGLALRSMKNKTTNGTAHPAVSQPIKEESPESEPGGEIVNLDESAKNTILPGIEASNSELINVYGKYAFEAFQKKPDLIDKIKAVYKNFNPSLMETSSLSRSYQLNNGKEYLVLRGCTAHICAGTRVIVLFNEKENLICLAKENESETQIAMFGNPGDEEKKLLLYSYFHP